MPKSKISKFISILLNIMLIGGTICLFFLNKLYDTFKTLETPNFTNHTIYYQIAFYLCYIICIIIIFKLRKIFNIIYKDTPFKKEIETSLKIVAILFMSLSIVIGIKIIFIPTILSFAVVAVAFIASLSFYVLSQIFKVAIEHKKELDYTI